MVREADWAGLWVPNLALTRAAQDFFFFFLHISVAYDILYGEKKGRKKRYKKEKSPDVSRLSKHVL